MNTPVNIQAAKTHLSRLVEQAAKGEEVVIAKAGKPMAKLVPFTKAKKPRTPGLLAGQIWEGLNCWESEEQLFEDSINGPLYHGAEEESSPPIRKT